MASQIKIKRSSQEGKVPVPGDLELGELAINTFDGKLFLKKNDGTESIVEIGAGGSSDSNITAAKKQEFIATAAQTTFTITNGYGVGTVQVFANGILLASEDYIATNGTTVVLTQARVAGDNIIVTSGGAFQSSGGGTTTNALTVGTGLAFDSGTTFDGSAAKTILLATSGVVANSYGSSTSIPIITVDTYGRITSVSSAAPAAAGGFWSTNTSSGGNITVFSPTGYSTAGRRLIIVVFGTGVQSSTATSGGATFGTIPAGSNTKIYNALTGPFLGSSTTISGITGFAMAYAYLVSSTSGSSGNDTSSTTTSATLISYSGNHPRMVAVSVNSTLNLAAVASTAAGGSVTWAPAVAYQHPNSSSLSAAVWIGTGYWINAATASLTSNTNAALWHVTGIGMN